MIEIKQLDDTQQGLWDDYVEQSPEATPYHRFAWGRAVEASYGFEMAYFAAFEENNIVGILPLIVMKKPFGKTDYVSLPYCDCAGVIASSIEAEEKLTNFAVQTLSKGQSASLTLRNGNYSSVQTDTIEDNAKVRMILPLEATVDEQMAAFKSKLRSQIRKAEKNGLHAKVVSLSSNDTNKQHIDGFYKVMAANMRSLGSPVHSKAWFSEILSNYGNNAFLALVYKHSLVVGGAIVITNQNKASIPWASTLAEYNKLAPNMLLYWTVLSEAVKRKMQSFDFGRSTLNEGTYKFKKQWGCEPSRLMWLDYRNGELSFNEDMKKSAARELVESIWCKLPIFVTNNLGPIVRKYISL